MPTTPPPLRQPQSHQAILRAAQWVTLALVTGVLIFSGIVTFFAMTGGGTLTRRGAPNPGPGSAPPPSGPDANVLLMILAAFGVSAILAAFVLPVVMRTAARRHWQGRSDDEAAMTNAVRQFSVSAILRGALLEGMGLFGAVIVMLTGNLWALAAPVLAAGLMLAFFPGKRALQEWLDHVTGS